MKHPLKSRLLAALLVLVMVISMAPAPVFAADETATWSKVELADITAADTIMVTMTNPNGVTYALYTAQSGNAGNEAKVVTVNEDDTITTGKSSDYGWNFTAVDGGYTLSVDAGYLYTTDANNGVRVGSTAAVWTLDGSYLSTSDTGGNTRWLGVYDNNGGDYSAVATPNWRAYKNTTGNTKNQTVGFWKLTGTASSGPEDPVEPAGSSYTLTDTLSDGDVVIIYNAGNGAALTSTASGYKLAGEALTPADGVITTDLTTVAWTVSVNGDGTYSFSQGDMVLGMVQSGSYVNLSTNASDGHTGWTLSSGTADSTFYMQNATMPAGNYGPYYLEYYGGFTAYASNSPSDSAYGMSFYKLETSTPEEPSGSSYTLTDTLSDGDVVIIYNAGNGAALTSTASGYKLAGEALTPADGVITTDLTTVAWTVSVNSNGTYSFSQGDMVLGMVQSGSYVNLSTNASDGHTSWTLSSGTADSTFYMQNATMPAGNYGPYYLEYYNGFTAYASNSPSDSAYGMSFYKLPSQSQAAGKVTSAEQFTTGSYAMVIGSTGYGMGALDGTWISAVQPVIAGDQVTDAKGGVWTLTVDGTNVSIVDSNGVSIAPKGGNENGIKGASYQWTWTFDEATQTFSFYGQGSDTVVLASNVASENKFRGYKTITVSNNPNGYPSNFTLYQVDPNQEAPESGLPAAGDQVVIYNLAAKGVLAAENDTQSIENALAEIVDGKAVPANGGVVFKVEVNGEYHRFYNETYGYLCSTGTGNNAFYTKEASEDADWTLEALGGGYRMKSRTAKYNGTAAQYLEYYADSYKTYSFYGTNKDGSPADTSIYEFYFYGVADSVKTHGGIVNDPQVVFGNLPDAYAGADYTFSFTVDAVFGVEGELTVKVGDTVLTANDDGSYTIPAEMITGDSLTITVTGVDKMGAAISGTATVTVKDEPVIENVAPAAGSQTGENKRPVISADIVNAGENATVTMTVGGAAVDAVYADGKITYTPAADMADGRTSVTVTVKRADGKEASKSWSFTVGKAQFQLYFGQLHSHTTYSDGSGSLASALDYIKNLPESANVDFVAFTDHSNYFDASGNANPEGALYNMALATADSQKLWAEYVGAMRDFNASQTDVIAVPGFEMTWSGGPGHINTFNTPGIVSRNNTVLNNKTGDAGMKAYYALLSQPEGADSISQFNHPGSTFGTFTDFAYWDALIDTRIQLVEVGNGEGQVGAGGYYPSYEYYTMALDKGWHVAPTNNQDNHKGKWGNANDARDVILTDDFSEEGIYEAIRNMRMYSTEDKNLELYYTVNGLQLGSIIEEVPEKLELNVSLYDPDVSDSVSKVEVIVNSGKVAYTWDDPAVLATGELTVTLDPTYSYYYIRVTQGDGDLAVTAPVWVGESLKLGISSVECATSTPVTGEELEITTTLFNSEKSNATIKALTYAIKGGNVIGTDYGDENMGYTLEAGSTGTVTFKYTPDKARVMTITVTAIVELEGEEYTFSMDITLDVQDSEKLVYIGIDASHYNEYVNGNYKDSMGNFGQLAAAYGVRTVELYTSEDLIAACSNPKYKALILTAPSRRLADAQADPKTYSADELAAIKAFNEKGGMVILAGWSDNYENYPIIQDNPDIMHMAETQNEVLEALGSSLRIGDDATYDDVRSAADGVDKWRLYFNTYGENFLTEGVEVDPEHPYDRMYTEVFSHYGGATVYTVDGTLNSTVSPVVYTHASTYSVDVDKDGLGGNDIPKYAYAEGDDRLLAMAMEQLEGKGLIVVSGAAFMSNFEVQATIEDSGSEKNYSNYKICENLLAYINPVTVTPIAEVQAEPDEGVKYTIEGIVTSNASGYDKDTAFFDCIYVQDETGGINAFPVAGNFKIGDKVRITGTTSSYQGERQIAVSEIELIGEGYEVKPIEVTSAQINDGSVLGQLITLKGKVKSFESANGLIQTIMVEDANGDVARVFIDGYITTSKDVENLEVGCDIVVTGLASYDNSFDGIAPRIRIRDRADVVCTASAGSEDPTDPEKPGGSANTGDSTPLMLLSTLMIFSLAAIVILAGNFRRKKF